MRVGAGVGLCKYPYSDVTIREPSNRLIEAYETLKLSPDSENGCFVLGFFYIGVFIAANSRVLHNMFQQDYVFL